MLSTVMSKFQGTASSALLAVGTTLNVVDEIVTGMVNFLTHAKSLNCVFRGSHVLLLIEL